MRARSIALWATVATNLLVLAGVGGCASDEGTRAPASEDDLREACDALATELSDAAREQVELRDWMLRPGDRTRSYSQRRETAAYLALIGSSEPHELGPQALDELDEHERAQALAELHALVAERNRRPVRGSEEEVAR
jgi:hypothetical protein